MSSKEYIIDPDSLPLFANRWDVVLIGILSGMFLFMPAAFGAVEAWSELVTYVFAAVLIVYLLIRVALDSEFQMTLTWLYVPIALFIGLVGLQSAPLPARLARGIARSNVEIKEQLLGQVFAADEVTNLSFYPRASLQHLCILLIGAVLFVTVASTFRRRQHIKILLTIIFAVGCAEATLALAQIISRSGSIYWTIAVKEGVTTAGTFINYSNFSQFMNLSLGAGLALLLIRVEEERRRELDSGGWGRTARFYWERNAWLAAGIVLCALSILASMSRNGAISSMVAAAIIGVALYQRKSLNWRGWIVAAIPAGVLAALLIFGFDIVYDRLSTLRGNEVNNLRWEMSSAAFRAWQNYPILGTGLGTHEMVFPLFEHSVTPSVAVHADNDYAQLLEETGLVGVVLIAAFLIGTAILAAKLAFRGRKPESLSVFGIMFGLVAVAIHSSTDFGQRLPSNLCLSATMCGLIVAISRIERKYLAYRPGAPHSGAHSKKWFRTGFAAVALGSLAVALGCAIKFGYAAYLAERYWSAAFTLEKQIRKHPSDATDEEYIDLIVAAEGAYKNEPNNVKYGYWLAEYRWESLTRTVDPETGRILLHPDTIPFLARIADDLAVVRRSCPTYGPPYALEGQIRLLVLNDTRGNELIRKGALLAPYEASTCLVAGELALQDRDFEEAVPLLERAVNLEPGYFRRIVELYLFKAKRPDLARSLAADNHNRLYELSSVLATTPAYSTEADNTRKEAEQVLLNNVAKGEGTPSEVAAVANLERDRGQLESAITFYRRALSQDYQQAGWRMELARTLAKVGNLDDAMHEVKIVLRLRPRDAEATKLLEELVARQENVRVKAGR